MPSTDSRACFEAFLRAINRRDIGALAALTHPDFVESYVQSGEVIRGIENLGAILENFPGGYEDRGEDRVIGSEDRWVVTPSFTLVRIEGAGDTFTGVMKARYPDGSDWYVVHIAELRDGLVWRVQAYFAPAFEPPDWRSQWVEVEGPANG
jgi:hypothetical protein